jgi:hypothetical protein
MVDLLVYTNHRIGDMYYNSLTRAANVTKSEKLLLKYHGRVANSIKRDVA